jgi:hypothetical protein
VAEDRRIRTDFPHRVRVIEHVWIPLADGVRLSARIWLPEDAEQHPVPAILEYLPYRKGDVTTTDDAVRHPWFAGQEPLYDVLLAVHPSPVIELNRAAAVAMARGPGEGLRLLEAIAARGELEGYHLLPAARADLLRRVERWEESAAAYARALALAENEAERRYLTRRLADVRRAAQGGRA